LRFVHLPVYTAGLGTYPDRGLPQRHRAIPSTALDERQCFVVGVHTITSKGICQAIFSSVPFFENVLFLCYNK
jgi:predicted cobalt transporter CbtA